MEFYFALPFCVNLILSRSFREMAENFPCSIISNLLFFSQGNVFTCQQIPELSWLCVLTVGIFRINYLQANTLFLLLLLFILAKSLAAAAVLVIYGISEVSNC